MSETLCTLRTKGGGGGKYTETVLWTNPSPTSAFANQTVTLSDSVSNYKYIKFVFRFSTSNAKESSAIYSVDDVVAFSNSDGNFLGSGFAYPTVNVARSIIYKTATSIEFGTCYRSNTSGTYNSNLIPIEILGLNELDHGKRESSLGTLTYQTSSNFKVTLGFKPKALQVFMRGNDSNTITLQYDENISTTKYVRNYTASTPQSGWQTIGSTTNQRRLWSIDDDGFTLTPNTDTSTPTIYYSAVGDV